jgi:hypothetical protein
MKFTFHMVLTLKNKDFSFKSSILIKILVLVGTEKWLLCPIPVTEKWLLCTILGTQNRLLCPIQVTGKWLPGVI